MKLKNHHAVLLFLAFAVLMTSAFLVGTGSIERFDVLLLEYSVSEDGTELTLQTGVASSMGYTRDFQDFQKDHAHHLTFYSTYGGLNSSFGAKSEFTLTLDEADTAVYFACANGDYELILQKDAESGAWVRA